VDCEVPCNIAGIIGGVGMYFLFVLFVLYIHQGRSCDIGEEFSDILGPLDQKQICLICPLCDKPMGREHQHCSTPIPDDVDQYADLKEAMPTVEVEPSGLPNLDKTQTMSFSEKEYSSAEAPCADLDYITSLNYVDQNLDMVCVYVSSAKKDVRSAINYGVMQKMHPRNMKSPAMHLVQSWKVAYAKKCFWTLKVYFCEDAMQLTYEENECLVEAHVRLNALGDLVYTRTDTGYHKIIATHVNALCYDGCGRFYFKKIGSENMFPIEFHLEGDTVQMTTPIKSVAPIDIFLRKNYNLGAQKDAYSVKKFLKDVLPSLSGFKAPQIIFVNGRLNIQYRGNNNRDIWVLRYDQKDNWRKLQRTVGGKVLFEYTISFVDKGFCGFFKGGVSGALYTRAEPLGSVMTLYSHMDRGDVVQYTDCRAPALWRNHTIFNSWFFTEDGMGMMMNMAQSFVKCYYSPPLFDQLKLDFIEDAFDKKTYTLFTYPLPINALTYDQPVRVSFIRGKPANLLEDQKKLHMVCSTYTSISAYTDTLSFGKNDCLFQWERESLSGPYLKGYVLLQKASHHLQFHLKGSKESKHDITFSSFIIEVSDKSQEGVHTFTTMLPPPLRWSISTSDVHLKSGVCLCTLSLSGQPYFELRFFYIPTVIATNKMEVAHIGWELQTCGDDQHTRESVFRHEYRLDYLKFPQDFEKNAERVLVQYKA